MIEIKNLRKTYGANIVLNDIDLTFKPSKLIGLVGKNGAGKTTLFKCVSGLETYDGVIHLKPKESIHKIGYLPTNPYIMSRITGQEYLQLLCNARNKSLPKKGANIFNLPLDEYAENYSTGMLKKLALTGILLQGNAIFLLDEPFNGLDLESNIKVNLILEKLKAKNKTIIISSHILDSLFKICDEINLLVNGKIERFNQGDGYSKIEDVLADSNFKQNLDSIL
ncbi:MAG: ATP-binding cassette domain-containing protein [Saprospiraceae bacterium]|nr:ATP-binding cassette domain-containing protein [Saprospiraceae bacterium]